MAIFCLFFIGNYAYSQTTLFFDNCNAQGGWTNTGAIYPVGTSGYNWQCVSPITPASDHTGGGQCFYVEGNSIYPEAGPGNYILYQLVSPTIDLTGYTQTRLEFWMQMRSETGNWDGGFVELSTNNGATWTLIDNSMLCVAYDGNMSQNMSSIPFYPYLHPAWFNYRTTWTRVLADISAYDNVSQFRLRYTFHSDEAANELGWTIDDVKIVSICLPQLTGNGVVISDGDLTPSFSDSTDMGNAPVGSFVEKMYWIHNIGESPLTLTGTPWVQTTGLEFSVSQQPTVNVIAAGDSVSFKIKFSPTVSGTFNGTVNIPNSDDFSSCFPPNPYNFAIKANALNTAPWITGLHDVTICPSASGSVNFVTHDNEQALNTLTVTTVSSDPALLPNANILYSGSGVTSSLSFTPTPGLLGDVIVTVTVNDLQTVNNDSVFTFTVHIADTVPPNALCQNISLQLDNTGNATLTAAQINNGTTDNCVLGLLSIDQTAYTCADVGVNNQVFTAIDLAGNQSTCNFTVTIIPTPLIVNYTTSQYPGNVQISCFGLSDGSINISPQFGCPPYQYAWVQFPANDSASANNLTAGIYAVSVTDSSGQTVLTNIPLIEPTILTDATIHKDVTCYGKADGQIHLQLSGGSTPYHYSSGPILNNLPSGFYQYIAADTNNCTLNLSYLIAEPEPIITEAKEFYTLICGEEVKLEATASGGTGQLTYNWEPDAFLSCNNCIAPSCAPDQNVVYLFSAYDENNCVSHKNVKVMASCEVYFPNSFTPNGDGFNDEFRAISGPLESFTLKIYDRWGMQIFNSDNINKGWNGISGNTPFHQGVYVYAADIVFPGGIAERRYGEVTLIR